MADEEKIDSVSEAKEQMPTEAAKTTSARAAPDAGQASFEELPELVDTKLKSNQVDRGEGSTPEASHDTNNRKKRRVSKASNASTGRVAGESSVVKGVEDAALLKILQGFHDRADPQLRFSDVHDKLRSIAPQAFGVKASTLFVLMMRGFETDTRFSTFKEMIRGSYEEDTYPVGAVPQPGASGTDPGASATQHVDPRDVATEKRPLAKATKTNNKLPPEAVESMGWVNVQASRMLSIGDIAKEHLLGLKAQLKISPGEAVSLAIVSIERLQDAIKVRSYPEYTTLLEELQAGLNTIPTDNPAYQKSSAVNSLISEHLSIIRDEKKIKEILASGGCSTCLQHDIPLVERTLVCEKCPPLADQIKFNDDYCTTRNDANGGIRCQRHRTTGVNRNHQDSVVQLKHGRQLQLMTCCSICHNWEHNACAMKTPSRNNGLGCPTVCSSCKTMCTTEQGVEGMAVGWFADVKPTTQTAMIEDQLHSFLRACGHESTDLMKLVQGEVSRLVEASNDNSKRLAFRLLSEQKVHGRRKEAWDELCRFKDETNAYQPLPLVDYRRSFYGLFYHVNGAWIMVFAMTTQTSVNGDLFIEYMDSVNMLPLGILRAELYRLGQLCLIAHQRGEERNAACLVQRQFKLWSSSPSDGRSYLIPCRPPNMRPLESGPLRETHITTFEVSRKLGMTDKFKTREPLVVHGSGDKTMCIAPWASATTFIPEGGQLAVRCDLAQTAAERIMLNAHDAKAGIQQITKLARKVLANMPPLSSAGNEGSGDRNVLGSLESLQEKLDTKKLESVGDFLLELNAAIPPEAKEKASETIKKFQRDVTKLAAVMLDMEDPSPYLILMSMPACKRELACKLLRAWCRADQDDMMSAQILQPEASVGGVGVRSSGATGNATPGPSIAEADTDESGVNGSPAEIDGGSEGNGIDRGSAGAISAGKIRPPSLLLHPTEEINSVLQAIAGSCSSSIGDTGDLADDVRPSRPLFDKPTELLDVCEERALQFDTAINAAHATAALVFLSSHAESLEWKCTVCSKTITNLRVWCEDHQRVMCGECVTIPRGATDRPNCPMGNCKRVFARKVLVLGGGSAATAAPSAPATTGGGATRRSTRSSNRI